MSTAALERTNGSKAVVRKIASYVLEHGTADPRDAHRHFSQKLALECDSWDVHEDMKNGVTGFVVLDVRSREAYAKGHIPGAISFPHRTMDAATTAPLPKDKVIVTYCTGSGCNASTKAAARLASLGFQVKELIGGLDFWIREGFAVEGEKASSKRKR